MFSFCRRCQSCSHAPTSTTINTQNPTCPSMTIVSATTAGWKASNVLNVRNSLFLRRQVKENSSQVRETPLWFCQCCKIREVQRRGGNSGKVPGVIHCFCDSCYKPKLSECAKNTPRGKRSITAVQKNVDSSCLDPVRKELLPVE